MGPQWQWIGNLITAVATISGVLIAQAYTRRTEKTKADREDATRWLQERRKAYADFLGAALARREVISYHYLYELGGPHHPLVDQRLKDLAMNHEGLYLIAPTDVTKHADQVREALRKLFDDSRRKFDASDPLPPRFALRDQGDNQASLDKAVLKSVIEFRKAARLDLGIEAAPAEAAAVDK